MWKNAPVLFALFTLLSCTACASDEPASDGPSSDRFPAELAPGADFDDAAECDVDTPCTDGLTCAYVDLGNPSDPALCVDPASVCERLDCGDGECVILESFPARVACSGTAPDDGSGDEPVGN